MPKTYSNCQVSLKPIQLFLLERLTNFSYAQTLAFIILVWCFADSVKPVCLPITPELQAENLIGQQLEVAGWGATEVGLQSPVLLRVSLPTVSNEDCQKAYNGLVLFSYLIFNPSLYPPVSNAAAIPRQWTGDLVKAAGSRSTKPSNRGKLDVHGGGLCPALSQTA